MPETNKRADTTYPIHDLLSSRWSPRAFADRPILPEVLGSLFEAAPLGALFPQPATVALCRR